MKRLISKLDINKIKKDLKKFKIKKFLDIKNFDRKQTLIAIGIIGLLISSVVYFSKGSQTLDSNVKIAVSTENVKVDSISIKSTFIGKIRTAQSVTLSSEVVGKITYMKPDGASVQKGESILKLDDQEAQAKYMVALGKKSEEELKLNTIKLLHKEGFRTENHVKEQEAKYQTAQGHLMEAKAYLNKHEIKAPFNGVIGLQNQSIGTTINQHTKLITVSNFDNLEIEFVVPEEKARDMGGADRIKTSEIFVTIDGHLLPIEAQFSAYETVIDSETQAISVRARLNRTEDNKSIVPGQLGKVILNLGSKDNVLTVSDSAVEISHGTNFVYKIVKGMAIQIPVKIGIRDGSKIEIISGLSEGDEVVTSGQFRLSDGQSVQVEK
jgi:membrane fusion protein (multidrug efflux system)